MHILISDSLATLANHLLSGKLTMTLHRQLIEGIFTILNIYQIMELKGADN